MSNSTDGKGQTKAINQTEKNKLNWALIYERLLREKVFYKLKFELQYQKGSKQKVQLLESMLHNLEILEPSDRESLILTEIIHKEIEFLRRIEEEEEEEIVRKIEKIKWKASPSIFGFLMNELVKHGYIEPPLRGGEYNFTGLAKLCCSYFEINSPLENVIKELNPNKNALSDVKRAKFTIPELSDLQ